MLLYCIWILIIHSTFTILFLDLVLLVWFLKFKLFVDCCSSFRAYKGVRYIKELIWFANNMQVVFSNTLKHCFNISACLCTCLKILRISNTLKIFIHCILRNFSLINHIIFVSNHKKWKWRRIFRHWFIKEFLSPLT